MPIWENNRGEWTEAYVFLKLLGDGRIFGADALLQKDDCVYIDVESIFRYDNNETYSYVLTDEEKRVVSSFFNGEQFLVTDADEFSSFASSLYNQIINSKTGKRKFSVPSVQSFLVRLKFKSPKAPSIPEAQKERYGEKADIIMMSRDSFDRAKRTEGFSIKSFLGAPPTLFNAAVSSRFVYKLKGCNDHKMHQINSKDGFMKLVKAIKSDPELKLEFVPEKMDETFAMNVEKVDSRMLEILDAALRIWVGLTEAPKKAKLTSVVEALCVMNPLENRDRDNFYPSKFKDFLFASFAGLTASTYWNGRRKITGGYILVKNGGEMLYYRALSDDLFSSYLFNNTQFVTPSRGVNAKLAKAEGRSFCKNGRALSPKERDDILLSQESARADYGYIYKDNDEFYFTINFQIRFRKLSR